MKIQLISSLIALQLALPAFANEGQSEWMTGDGMSAAQSGSFGGMSAGQSEWMNPGNTSQQSMGEQASMSGMTGQSGWMQPSGNSTQQSMGAQASMAGMTGQSGWMQPSGQSDHAFAATAAPSMASQSMGHPQLQGMVSNSGLQGNSRDSGIDPVAEEMAKAHMRGAVAQQGGGGGMGGLGAGMEMLGGMMAIPMMMAATAAMSRPFYGYGGFRGYGFGYGRGMSVGQAAINAGIGTGAYALGRAANRAMRRMGR